MVNSIEANSICFSNVFNNFSFNVEKNKITSVSGSNNCGKTSLIRILSKQIDTNSDIKVFDKDINDYKLTDYYKIVRSVIPLEEQFIYEVVEDELNYYLDQLFLSKEEKNKT